MAAVSDEDIDSEGDVRPLIDAICDEDPCEVDENKCDDSPDADNERVAAPVALFVSIAETGELPELETVLISESDWRLEIEALLETVDRELWIADAVTDLESIGDADERSDNVVEVDTTAETVRAEDTVALTFPDLLPVTREDPLLLLRAVTENEFRAESSVDEELDEDGVAHRLLK